MSETKRSRGTVKWFSAQKGFGFIAPDDGGEDLYVHQTSIKSEGFRTLSEGQAIEFDVDLGEDGRTKAVWRRLPDPDVSEVAEGETVVIVETGEEEEGVAFPASALVLTVEGRGIKLGNVIAVAEEKVEVVGVTAVAAEEGVIIVERKGTLRGIARKSNKNEREKEVLGEIVSVFVLG